MPKKEKLAFSDSQQLKATATAAYQKSEQVYYEGAEPKSSVAKFIRDATFRITAWLGPVITKNNLETPEDLQKFIEQTNNSLEDAQRKNYIYEKKMAEFKHRLAVKDKITRDKVAEVDGVWQWRIFSGIGGFIILIIVVVLIGGFIQMYTGIPVLKIMFGFVGGFIKTAKQTIMGLQEGRDELKKRMADDTLEEKEREAYKQALSILDERLHKHQDDQVKRFVKTHKSKAMK
jgi:hypothetical protein